MSTETKKPVVVPNSFDANHANALYGESYGIDWVYEGRGQTEAFSSAASGVVALVSQEIKTCSEMARQLCYAIESLPASEKQTDVSVQASALSKKLRALLN